MNTNIIILSIAAYLLGAIPFGLIVSKLKKVNLRAQGSGNIGATNVFRVMGWRWALLVFLLDAAKGFIPTQIALNISDKPLLHITIGLIAIIGHSLTIFAGFKGGKGAATGLGVIFALSPDVFLIVAGVAALIISVTRYVSLATIICSLLTVFLLYYLEYPMEYVYMTALIALLIILRHQKNIQRLWRGKENKI